MNEADEEFRRTDLKRGMRQVFDQTLDERLGRYLEVAHQGTRSADRIFRVLLSAIA